MDDKRIDEIAATLDDIATMLDEVKAEPCSASQGTLDKMRLSIERAADAIDRIANKEVDADQSSAVAPDRKI
jgi:hypothetical protein